MTFTQRFPQDEGFIKSVAKEEPEFRECLRENKRVVKQYIKGMSELQSNLYKISETNVKVKKIKCDTEASTNDADSEDD